MPFSNIDVAAFIVEPPDFTYQGGLFHIRQRYSDNCVIERVMPPSVFFASIRKAVEAARLHKFGGAEIVPFKREWDIAAEH